MSLTWRPARRSSPILRVACSLPDAACSFPSQGQRHIIFIPSCLSSRSATLSRFAISFRRLVSIHPTDDATGLATANNPTIPTSALVITGPFRFTRNPLYVGATLI
jgi:hypothetical protein